MGKKHCELKKWIKCDVEGERRLRIIGMFKEKSQGERNRNLWELEEEIIYD
jgi:hypothetical protein